MCCDIIDIDGDTRNEIVIGSYGGELLIYRASLAATMTNETTTTNGGTTMRWQLVGTRSFAAPIYRIFLCGFLGKTGKRNAQLCVLTADGVSILQ